MIGHVSAALLPGLVCKAWVLFDPATGTVQKSSNVTSLVRNGVNDHTITFTVAMSTLFYLPVCKGIYQGQYYPVGCNFKAGSPLVGSTTLNLNREAWNGPAAQEPYVCHISFWE